MQTLNRRRFVEYLVAGAAAAGAGGVAATALRARSRVVVVGGGPAGAAAALALRQTRPDTQVLLVERDPGRLGRAEAAAFDRPAAGPDLGALRRAGVDVVLDDVVDLDWTAARLDLFSGRSMAFDRLLLAPGTAAVAEPIAGFGEVARHLWPAAWGSAREARRLKAQLAALPEAGHVVLRLPAVPSHPEAALDRAVQMATLLDRTRPRGRLTVLDGTAGTDLADRFERRRAELGLRTDTDWRRASAGGTVLGVDVPRGTLETDAGLLRADVVNFVTLQEAGRIARTAGLVDATGWCPTDAQGRSTQRREAVILGDARKAARRTVAGALLSAKAAAAGDFA
ncbi:sulfide dehydrogenase [flavocytochrome c] flavoprotein subunit [Rhodovulum iodosum]|uniref:Sulfide dehydrogenase [flavocytochrome c] flavoprotein subunit n=1 Tax=Rhodovulum iodosum TaxID=68291 RepID=A0ABV3XX55_9RHOB|nr:FAD-dependent oxidoreductase [Rhodovulum robiginosum]